MFMLAKRAAKLCNSPKKGQPDARLAYRIVRPRTFLWLRHGPKRQPLGPCSS